MLVEVGYDRETVVKYAQKWAFERNPRFFVFDNLGGDCTNFASQCVYAGAKVMNYTPVFGWYFKNINSRSPSWTGVEFLHKFLVGNLDVGPYASNSNRQDIKIGDIIQLQNQSGRFYHSLVIVRKSDHEIYVATHTKDAYYKPLSSYIYYGIRYIHILGVRKHS